MGEGQKRIGRYIVPTEDIYCMMVLASLKDEFIKERVNLLTDNEKEAKEEETESETECEE